MRNEREEVGKMQATLTRVQETDVEARVIDAAKAGAPDAWRELYHRYFPKMYTYAYCRIGDSAAAEDIAAEVFLEAWKRIGAFRYYGVPISAWLYRIAHNLSTDFVRRRKLIRFEHLSRDGPYPQLKEGNHEDAIAIRDEVVAALRRLTAEQHQVVVMRFMEGMSRAEVVVATGKSEEAVKALQHRALKSLRQQLKETRHA